MAKKIIHVFNSRAYWLAFLLILLGIGASFYLTYLHFKMLGMTYGGATVCNVSSYVNCDAVLMSSYSHLGTLPLAGVGLLFYIYLLGAFIYAGVEKESAARVLALPFLFISISVILSVFLAYVSIYQIQAVCIFCTSLYLINIFLFLTVKRVTPMSFKEWISQLKIISPIKSISYFLIIFILGGTAFHLSHSQLAQAIPQAQLDKYIGNFLRQPQVQINTEGRPFFGNPDAKIVIAEFSDFECPHCKKAAFSLKHLLRPYKDQIKLVFMNFPLDPSCNLQMQQALHRRACVTAYAAYCAGQQGKFWEYHDKAFKRQPKFQKASLENMAKKLDLNLPKFQKCVQDPETKKIIMADIDEGLKAGILGTPAIYVNGRPFVAWTSGKAWKQLFEMLLETKGS